MDGIYNNLLSYDEERHLADKILKTNVYSERKIGKYSGLIAFSIMFPLAVIVASIRYGLTKFLDKQDILFNNKVHEVLAICFLVLAVIGIKVSFISSYFSPASKKQRMLDKSRAKGLNSKNKGNNNKQEERKTPPFIL